MKKIAIIFIITFASLLVVRKIRLDTLVEEGKYLMRKSDIMLDSMRNSIITNNLDFEQRKALGKRCQKVINKLDTVSKKIDFWNLKL